jgi:hypothetical protein
MHHERLPPNKQGLLRGERWDSNRDAGGCHPRPEGVPQVVEPDLADVGAGSDAFVGHLDRVGMP